MTFFFGVNMPYPSNVKDTACYCYFPKVFFARLYNVQCNNVCVFCDAADISTLTYNLFGANLDNFTASEHEKC